VFATPLEFFNDDSHTFFLKFCKLFTSSYNPAIFAFYSYSFSNVLISWNSSEFMC
jgi:hypothetical protein